MTFDKREYKRQWYLKNRERHKEHDRQNYLQYRQRRLKIGRQYQLKNRDKILEYQRQYRLRHHEKRLKLESEWRKKRMIEAYTLIGRGRIKCFDHVQNFFSPCYDIRIMQIHHLNGGGSKDRRGKGHQFYTNIVSGKRKIDDLILLCANCHRLRHNI